MKELRLKIRVRVLITGIVQGVGFRPYLYRSAHKYKLSGSVRNTSQGVILEVEGFRENVTDFVPYILKNSPPLSLIESCETFEIPLEGSNTFEIIASENTGKGDLLVSPDIAICENCKTELFDRQDRRFRYPFINCTDCGPRFSIIRDLPYDRPKTTMKDFPMCGPCEEEYGEPYDRRYHAQPVSCYQCGPTISLLDKQGNSLENPLETACEKIKEGHIVAIKGLGGYHLACKATLDEPVMRLRELKGREKKPFALMGSQEMIEQHALVSDTELKLLSSPASPILLLERKMDSPLSEGVAPNRDTIGFMLPYTPLHLLLLDIIKEPLVMTSANISDEPIIYRDDFETLGGLCDYILANDRDIHIFADDSVARVFDDKLYMIRRSRGYVPFPLKAPVNPPQTILALGPMLKTTFTFLYNGKGIMSQYIGDTDSPASLQAEKNAIRHFLELFSLQPGVVVMDKHPGYPNRQLAEEFKEAEVLEIQHHEAHVGALLAERGHKEKIIGIAMDGTGYGDDGNIWGGEFFVGDYRGLQRFGHLKYQFLPSGDMSAKEPWRFAISLLHSLYGSSPQLSKFMAPFGQKGEFLLEAIKKKAGGVVTSSCGRLFDAAASILGIGNFNNYEGELPIRLQDYAEQSEPQDTVYNYKIEKENNCRILDLLPAIGDMLKSSAPVTEKAYIFHRTLAKGIVDMVKKAAEEHNIHCVGLTGGVFQNTLLLKLTKDLLEKENFSVLLHSQVPANDGGISLGQAFLAAGILENRSSKNK